MNTLPIKQIGANGAVYWELNGKLHRENGPAIEYTSGYRAWVLHDTFIKEVVGER